MDGFLVVDKPAGMTSRDVVNRIQRMLPRRTKIGHTGTLDPLATGVLVLCIGKATKLADQIQALGKVYATQIRLDASSNTDDADGEVAIMPNCTMPTIEQIREQIPKFIGVIQQKPPAFSALKVGGKRSYDLARKGEAVELASRPVRVDRIDLLEYQWPMLSLEIACGKGTYIRSIARDLGAALNVAGMVQTLRRLSVGQFQASQGIHLEMAVEKILPLIIPVDDFRNRYEE